MQGKQNGSDPSQDPIMGGALQHQVARFPKLENLKQIKTNKTVGCNINKINV